jgi:hypothetical protein
MYFYGSGYRCLVVGVCIAGWSHKSPALSARPAAPRVSLVEADKYIHIRVFVKL